MRWLAAGVTLALALVGCVDTSPPGDACGGTTQNCPAGMAGAGGSSGGSGSVEPPSPPVVECESVGAADQPLGCELAWGANGNSGNRAEYLDVITTWVGYEEEGGLNGRCDGCALASALSSGSARVAYYAYFIGYRASADGYGDCNTDFDGQNLCTHGAGWLKEHRAEVLEMYANYARMTHRASPDKAVLWLLEGDFVQYTYEDQGSPLSMRELGALAADIVCAIKSNAPGSLVAINHSPWLANEVTDRFWRSMPLSVTDMVWTTGVGDNAGFIGGSTDATTYNGATARYDYLYELTGKRIFVDTSFGVSQQADSWSNNPATTLNQRIAEGVSAVNVTQPGNDYRARIETLGSQLSSTCR